MASLGVGGRNLPEGKGVVHNGREKVHGLDYGNVVADLVDSGVVAGVKTHHQALVRALRQVRQQISQDTRSYLGASAAGGGHLAELELFRVHRLPPFDILR